MRSKTITGFILISLLIVTSACLINLGGPKYPSTTIPVSTQALGSLQNQLGSALTNPTPNQQLTLFLTESELTSYLSNLLGSKPDPLITNPQVFLRDGQIQVYGTATRGNFQANVKIVLTATIDSQGKLSLELVSADFGPIPVPKALNEVITSLVTEAFTGSLGPMATGIRIEGIVIAEGAMMIVGRIN